jgi:hypothetical protein
VPLDEKTLGELKLAAAHLYQQLFASENLLNLSRTEQEVRNHVLADWENRLLPIARRHEKNPVRFCETVMGPNWFTAPTEVSSRSVRELLKMAPAITGILSAPQDLSGVDGRQLLKHLQTLAAKQPRRKSSEMFGQALQLREKGKTFHKICLELNPTYAQISPANRRTERERMRSGVSRLQQKAKNKSKGSRNTPR